MPPPVVLAHRGARRVAPENTLAAFAAARDEGADGVELDVRRSADGELVIHHDAAVPDFGVLAEHAWADIHAALPQVPTLAEALDACAGMLVNVEIKNLPGDPDHDPDERAAAAVVGLLADRGQRDQVVVSSFSVATVDAVHALDRGVETALLMLVGFDVLAGARVAADRGHRAVHPDVRGLVDGVVEPLVEQAQDLVLAVRAWTVNDPEAVRRLARAGVDGIITDVPAVALAALAELGGEGRVRAPRV